MTDFRDAADLIIEARREAEMIIADAERAADLIMADADRTAAAKRSESEIYLQKARSVLEIAQQRARVAAPNIDLEADEPAAIRTAAHQPASATPDTDQAGSSVDTEPARKLPGELDRILSEAVDAAVTASIETSQRV